jgi:hypothetical protein
MNLEMHLCGKERHLPLRIAPICAVRVCLDKFSDREAICSFLRRDRDVCAHLLVSLWQVWKAMESRSVGIVARRNNVKTTI